MTDDSTGEALHSRRIVAEARTMARTIARFGVLLAALMGGIVPHAFAAAQGNAQVLALLASAHTRSERGDLAGALDAAGRAAALAPDCPEVHATLALLHHRRGDVDRAAEHYTRFQLLNLRERGCAEDDLTQRIAEAEGTMVLLVNSERLSRRLPPLRPDPTLAEMARAHSDDMRDHGYFGHESPVPRNRTIGDRFRRAFGRSALALAENVSRMSGTLWSFTPENVRDSHDRLMRSPGHCANILWDRANSIGVGIAVSSGGDYWITENFALLEP